MNTTPPPSPAASPDADRTLPRPSELSRHWMIDPGTVYLNHGSFGACPRPVLEAQSRLRDLMERDGVRYFVELLPGMIDDARAVIAKFLHCEGEDLVFVPNATTGVATVLHHLAPKMVNGDEFLMTSHEYPACANNMRHTAEVCGAKVKVAELPFPVKREDDIVEAILRQVTDRTRVALISHITAQSGLVLPIARIVKELESRGVRVIVDGAHSPGMVEVDIRAIGASYYAANCHKWICAPKGAAVLYIRRDRQLPKDQIGRFRPIVLSNMAENPRPGRKHLLTEFDYVGTQDVSPWVCIPAAIGFMEKLFDGGWPEVRKRNHELVLRGRDLICRAIGEEPPAPDAMLGSMSTIILPRHDEALESRLRQRPTKYHDALQDELYSRYRIQVPVWGLPGKPERFIRISAQVYNSLEQYEYLATALADEIERERSL